MPVGILIILLACFGVNSLIGLSSVSFPASVALLVALFFALIACDLLMGERWTGGLVNVIDVPVRVLLSINQNMSNIPGLGWLCSSLYKSFLYALVRPSSSKSSH